MNKRVLTGLCYLSNLLIRPNPAIVFHSHIHQYASALFKWTKCAPFIIIIGTLETLKRKMEIATLSVFKMHPQHSNGSFLISTQQAGNGASIKMLYTNSALIALIHQMQLLMLEF